MDNTAKKIFISYSWSVQERVIELAERLISNGIDVIIDVYDLKEGQDKYAFMEQSVNDPSINRVLIICDKTYTEKANNRTGGVGDETVIISPEIYGKVKQEKFIPVIFEKDDEGTAYCPHFIKSRIYVDLSNDNVNYEKEYEKLLRNIYDKPVYKKPALGTKPEWIENETVDLSSIRDIIKQLRGYTGNNQAKVDFLVRKASDEFLKAAKQYVLPDDKPMEDTLLTVIESTKPYRDIFIDYCEALLYSQISINEILSEIFEKLYNNLHDATGKSFYTDSDFELYDFIIQELFISVTALLLHYEKYSELNLLLTHTYFLKTSFSGNYVEASLYFPFRKYMHIIEGECKSKCSRPNLFSLTAEIMIGREKNPTLTKESISNADIFLYQFSCIITSDDFSNKHWFPTTYIYHNDKQIMWKKLKSAEYCHKIAPLFGVNTIDELKENILKSKSKRLYGYKYDYDGVPQILDSIKYEDIGIMN